MNFFRIAAFLALLLTSSVAEAANRFWVGGTGTWDAVTTTHWSATSGGAGGASVPGSGDFTQFDASSGGGTVTVATNFNVQGLAFTNYTGTFDMSANNNSPTINGFGFAISQASGGATINCGSGTWNIAQGNSNIVISNVTSVTLSCTSATFAFTSTGNTFDRLLQLTSGASIGPVTIAAGLGGGTGTRIAGGGGTIASLAIDGPNNVHFQAGQTLNITNAFTLNPSGSASAMMILEAQGNGSAATISIASGSAKINWAAINQLTFSGGATFTATNSYDIKGNTGISITNPSGGGGGRGIIGG